MMWVLVEPHALEATRTFRIVGTGHAEVPLNGVTHIGTVQDGPYVWHFFEERA